ncbi:MAG: DUF4407 domain-containing protein [Algoriphagus sp.]|uniref:DUF4407 domain-containing protein n=1 Tax=Algoriphagus sp. TaxID=1872435 RepID=UPI00262B4086|nr:DUF4407 domain-containing protein [Algoriphagus sp.]MDG1278523.1 DUF4407 domain-containing protein [Algoriphagus sp.]
MKDWWLKFGCFLTGYNYQIIKNSSEVSAKAVKKYLSALLIISGVWGFIGFFFTQRYLKTELLGSVIGSVILVFLIIQIERQIILSIGKNLWASSFRVVIGLVMAILGSIIIDQIIFKEDVEKRKISDIQSEVNNLLPIKTLELKNQIAQIDSLLNSRDFERNQISNEVSLRPTISIPSSEGEFATDSTGKMVLVGRKVSNTSILNPKAELIPLIDKQIAELRDSKNEKEKQVINMQEVLEQELKSKVGFLDELKTLFSIILESPVAIFVWVLWFIFFLAIELFVLVSKLGDNLNDYDKTITHQMNIRLKMLEKLVEE